VCIYQFLSRWLTPLFQSDRDVVAWMRDVAFGPLGRAPIARQEMLCVLAGIKRGWSGRLDLDPRAVAQTQAVPESGGT